MKIRHNNTLIALLFVCLAQPPIAQADRQAEVDPGLVINPVFSPAEQATLGIVGNGIHGIVGNGLLQLINDDYFVLNDRVYLTGPRTVPVTIDLQLGSLQDIGPGHVLQVNAKTASLDTDFAPNQVNLDSLIRGEVQSVVTAESNPGIRIFNQDIGMQNYSSVYDGPEEVDIDAIQSGDFVRVHGWLDQLGKPVVTRIDRLAGPPVSLELSGPVTAIDTAAAEFQINGLTIDYSTATLIYLNAGDLTLGMQLEATGTQLINSDTLQATMVRPVTLNIDQQAKNFFDVEGIISAPTAAFEVTLNGLSVTFNNQTVFDRGTVTDLVPGNIIEIDGHVTTANRLVADKIRFNQELLESEIRIFSTIESTDFDEQSITVLGLPVSYSAATRLDDHSGSTLTIEFMEDLAIGDYVEVRGYDQPDGQFMVAATRIKKEAADESLLRARVGMIGAESLELLGRQIVTNNVTEYETSSGAVISAEEFFSTVQIESLINAKVVSSGDTLLATELSFED